MEVKQFVPALSPPASQPIAIMLAYSEYELYRDGTVPARGPMPTYSPEDAKCQQDPKWWAFLLSSIFTFIAGKWCHESVQCFRLFLHFLGIFIVLLYRLFEFLFSGILFGSSSSNEQQSNAKHQQGQQHGGGGGQKQPDLLECDLNDLKSHSLTDTPQLSNDLGWMNEAKDWAGELISGQSTTGRILVRQTYTRHFRLTPLFPPTRLFWYFFYRSPH